MEKQRYLCSRYLPVSDLIFINVPVATERVCMCVHYRFDKTSFITKLVVYYTTLICRTVYRLRKVFESEGQNPSLCFLSV